MDRLVAELFTEGGNDAMVRLPGRRFPGVLIQGDSLSILRSDLAEAVEALRPADTLRRRPGSARDSAAVLTSPSPSAAQ
ncbi:DUF6959 family protein [Streptomyces sp. NPDC060064]|uniref:DUF6959 family protein n=1 Tax=Streptomyces sp. NPDC060064 TaxID=3347049 RepID=UPI0036C6029E